jgi:hypothetical protein
MLFHQLLFYRHPVPVLAASVRGIHALLSKPRHDLLSLKTKHDLIYKLFSALRDLTLKNFFSKPKCDLTLKTQDLT